MTSFGQYAADWWSDFGAMKPLMAMNQVRIPYLQRFVSLPEQNVLDVGCGGGYATEAMASLGAKVTGIDADSRLIAEAQQHASLNQQTIDYQCLDLFALPEAWNNQFSVITLFEVIEHIDAFDDLINKLSQALTPGGWLFISTLTRTPQSWLKAIVMAEYLLRLLPTGTHQYRQLIKPSELDISLSTHGLSLIDVQGIGYLPWLNQWYFQHQCQVNYLLAARKKNTPIAGEEATQ